MLHVLSRQELPENRKLRRHRNHKDNNRKQDHLVRNNRAEISSNATSVRNNKDKRRELNLSKAANRPDRKDNNRIARSNKVSSLVRIVRSSRIVLRKIRDHSKILLPVRHRKDRHRIRSEVVQVVVRVNVRVKTRVDLKLLLHRRNPDTYSSLVRILRCKQK